MYRTRHREPTSEALPSLPQVRLLTRGGQRREPARREILAALRQAARQSRRRSDGKFYTMRAVAAHFGISVTSVFRCYKTLRAEGLLTSTWGSQTTAGAASMNEKRRVRGIVAMPACLDAFNAVADERALILRIQDELWERGFAPRLFFHHASDLQNALFANVSPQQQFDAIVWVRPPAGAGRTAALLCRRNQQLFGVDVASPDFPGRQFQILREPAITAVLRNWRRNGVRSIVAALPRPHDGGEIHVALKSCTAELQMPVEESVLAGTTPELFLERLNAPHTGVVFPSSRFAAFLASRAPRVFERLTAARPLLLPGGPIDVPGIDDVSRRVTDVLTIPAERIARCVADELLCGRLSGDPQPRASARCAGVAEKAA